MSKIYLKCCFFQMSNKKQKDTDQEMSENSVNEILFAEETPSKKPKKDSKRLTTSSTQESGSGSLGEARIAKDAVIFPTPPDAFALVLELQGIRKVLGVIQIQAQPEIFW